MSNVTDMNWMLDAEVRQRLRDRRERIATAVLQGLLVKGEKADYKVVAVALLLTDSLIAAIDNDMG